MAVLLDDPIRSDDPAAARARATELARGFVPLAPVRVDGWPTSPSPVAEPHGVWRIERGMRIRGELAGATDVAIDGEFSGRIELHERRLSLGAVSRVRADVVAGTVVVRGDFIGTIRAGERVLLARTARVRGTIDAPAVSIEDGAVVDASITGGATLEH